MCIMSDNFKFEVMGDDILNQKGVFSSTGNLAPLVFVIFEKSTFQIQEFPCYFSHSNAFTLVAFLLQRPPPTVSDHIASITH